MIRFLALLCALGWVQAERHIVYFPNVEDGGDPSNDDQLFGSRAEAMLFCQSRDMYISHESQFINDMIKSGTAEGHRLCGWTDLRTGPIRSQCQKHTSDGKHCEEGHLISVHCKTRGSKYGVYCDTRAYDMGSHRFKIHLGKLDELYRLAGPFQKLNEAVDACEAAGGTLASWMAAAQFAERYDEQFCEYNILRVAAAVFKVNCENSRKIEWNIMDRDRKYGALCVGLPPHKFANPCHGQEVKNRELGLTEKILFPTLLGTPVTCEDGWIIVQQRPPCDQEAVSGTKFSRRTWNEFQHGFGHGDVPSGGFWLGLELMHRLSTMHKCEVKFELMTEDEKVYYAIYREFYVGHSSVKKGFDNPHYRLHVAKYDEKESTAGDMMNKMGAHGYTENGASFSAPNQDYDGHATANCAKERGSGWWYGACAFGDINGLCPGEEHYNPEKHQYRQWDSLTFNSKVGLRETKMLLRCREPMAADTGVWVGGGGY